MNLRLLKSLLFLTVLSLLYSCSNGFFSFNGNDKQDVGYNWDNYVSNCQCGKLIENQVDITPYSLSGSSYYVSQTEGNDKNKGDAEHPFATIACALEKAKGGDAIYVGNGDYGDLKFGMDHTWTGTAIPISEVFDDWVTLLPSDNAEPTLNSVILGTLNGDDYVAIPFTQVGNSDLRLRIDGFTIKEKIKIQGSRYVDIRNCHISQSGPFYTLSNEGKADFMGQAGIQVMNGQHISLQKNEITHTGLGIWAMSTDFVCRGNHIHHLMHDGIEILGGTNLLFEGNIIHDLDDGANDGEQKSGAKPYNMHVDGIQIYHVHSADKWAHDMKNLTIRNNLIFHAEAMGIMMSWSDMGTLSDFTWENNIFGPSNGTLVHLGAEVEGRFLFRHNTVLYTPHDQWTSHLGRAMGTTFGNPEQNDYLIKVWETSAHGKYHIYNNILTSALILTEPKYAGYAKGNIYYSASSDEILENAGGRVTTTLPYKEITGNLQDVIDSGEFPGILSDRSCAINAGVKPNDLDIISEDCRGNNRDSQPDIGAMEF